MKKLLLAFAAAALCAPAFAAEPTVLYERTADTWTETDLETWVNDNQYATQSIDGGLKVTSTNAGWNSTKAMTYTENTTVTLTATLFGGGATGRSGSYDFLKLGDVEVRLYGQDKKASVVIGETETNLDGYVRGADYSISMTIDQIYRNVTVTVSESATGTVEGLLANPLPENVILGHYKAGKENYEVNEILKDIKITEEIPVTEVTVLDQTFNGETVLENTDAYTWGPEVQGMITDNGLYITNAGNKANNYENRDFITFAEPLGNATSEVLISYEVYSPKDKGQNNTYYGINYFNADGEFVFGVNEASGGWAYTANIVTANADGTTTTTDLPAGHMKKAGGSVVDLAVKFSGENVIIEVDGGSYMAYSRSEGIKEVKVSVTGENGYERDMYVKNYVVKTNSVAAAQFADYTLKYVVDGTVIKEEVKSGIVGNEISLTPSETADFFNEEKTVKYIYVSNDAEGKTIVAEGTTVITLNYRLAVDYNYTVGNNVNDTVISGTCTEGESVTIAYSRYIIAADGTVWMKDAINKEYHYTFTPDADNFEATLTYSVSEMTDGIFFSEAENLEGMTEVTGSNADIRCSNAAGGYADAAVEVCTLKAGTYTVRIGVWGNSGQRFLVNAGSENVLYTETTGYWFEEVGDEFTLTEDTVITFEGATSTKPLDYILITGNGDITTAVEAVEAANAEGRWYNLQGVQVAAPTQPGLYIRDGKKVIVK